MATLKNPIFIYNIATQESIALQCVPKEMDYDPDSNFEAIASPGRNNALYHYTGSEDTLTIELDWYSNDLGRMDVIANCRKLEAHSKNDGWSKAPEPILLIWGNSLFGNLIENLNEDNNESWLIVKAPYKLSNFSRPHDMMPCQAYQTLTLKRITTGNRTRKRIREVKETAQYIAIGEPDLNGNGNPDFGFVIGSNNENMDSVFRGKESEKNIKTNAPKFLFAAPPSHLTATAQRIAIDLGKAAANKFANQLVYSAGNFASTAVATIQTIPNRVPTLFEGAIPNFEVPKFSLGTPGKTIPIPDFLQ